MTSHIQLDFLAAAEVGEIPERELRRYRRRHLDDCCAGCHLRTTVFEDFLYAAITKDPAARARCYASVAEGSVALAEAFAADRAEVERDLAALRSATPSGRVRNIRRASSRRFRSPLLVEALIEEGRGRLGYDGRDTLGWLAAARAVLTRAEAEVHGRSGHAPLGDLRLRIRAHEANALRVLGDLPAAERAFGELRRSLAAAEAPAVAVSAELASLEASLRYDQRRLLEAEALLDRAARFYRCAEDGTGLAKVLVQRGSILYIGGQPERAIPCYEAAAASVDAQADPALALDAHHNWILCLCAAGLAAAAQATLGQARALYHRLGDPTTRTQLRWIEGKVAAVLGDDEAALAELGAARDGYIARELQFDAALVSLDLAEVHLRRGETAEVKRLAEEMVPAFAERGVDREAERAVAIFYKAAIAEAVTLEIIAGTRAALLRAGSLRPPRT